MATTLKILDPVQGLIDYTNDIKPYHSKVIEALIEYVGTESIEVTVLEEFEFEIGLLYEFNGNYVCLIGGYGTPSFGDPENILVLSPDVSKTVIEYPAIGPGFFIVLGDKTVLFDPAVDVVLSISSSIEDKLIAVAPSIGSPLVPGGSFTVFGDKQAEYTVGLDFSIVGSAFNDGDYTVSSTTLIASPAAATQINVAEIIPTNNVEGFVSRISVTNTGSFSVVNSTYNSRHLIPHTTVFVTGISLLAPTLTDNNQRFVSYVNTQPLTYDSILSYSRALRHIGGSPVTSSYLADEGIVISGIVAVTPTSVSVLGDFQSSNLFVGDEFSITDSSGNDGTYNITSLTYEFSGSPVNDFVTTFGVSTLPDTSVDGNIRLNIPSNVFIIDGSDYTRFFIQGSRVNITTGSHIGQYTTLNSKYINDKTFIRVRETLIPEGTGRRILSTGANYITVDGDVTAIYGGGSPSPVQHFNIVTSAKNDGFYTVKETSYDNGTNTTQIVIENVDSFDPTDNTGEIHEFTAGKITHLPEGFGATVDLCELVPQALTISSITEDFDILLGHKFIVDGTDSATNKLYIQDPSGYAYGIFDAGINTPEGSPIGSPPIPFVPDTSIEIISSGINNGVYAITALETVEGLNTILTLAGSPALENSGTFSGSPEINGGFLLYKQWWQYYVTDITGGSPLNTFIISGDATGDINTSDKNIIQHIFTGNPYTVNSINFDGTNTTIIVNETIVKVAGSPPIDITAGSPTFDDWIISV